MEIIKKNIHMDRIRTHAVGQISLEDDLNISDSKPDVSTINFEKGTVVIDEVKPGTDQVNVRGRLVFSILYHSSEEGSSLATWEGRIPFDERIHMQGVDNTDMVIVEGDVEDLSISLINSRKLNCRSVITLNARVEELYDEEAPISIHGNEAVEYRRTPMELVQIAIDKNDIFRIKQEISLPSNYPNIYQILWKSLSLGDMEFKVSEGKINLQGDVHLFVLYEGEGENHPVRPFETSMPFSGVLECHGSREGMIPDIRYSLGQQEVAIRPDLDGEERNIGLELVMDICIKLYEEERVEILSDVYGVTEEVETQMNTANLKKLLAKIGGKSKVTDHIRIRGGSSGILQLLHSEGKVVLEKQEITEKGIALAGSLQIQVMYITGDDESPYANVRTQIPYNYTLEVPGIQLESKPLMENKVFMENSSSMEDMGRVHAWVEQLQVTMLDGEEMDVKAILAFSTTVFQNLPVNLIRSVKVEPLDSAKLGSLPGMAVYMVKQGDNLWNIGKKYYVPVGTLKELNHLASDELKPGQKLLIVKGA